MNTHTHAHTRASAIALTQVYTNRALALLSLLLGLSVFLYATFLLLTVTHAAGQTALQRQIESISSDVSDMETQYLLATRGITPDKALALGFTTPAHVSTVFATAGSLSLSLRYR